jgi:hypothetical protein
MPSDTLPPARLTPGASSLARGAIPVSNLRSREGFPEETCLEDP